MPHAAQSVLKPLGPEDPREVSGYRLLARIGEGGMGSVYLTRTRGDQPVALKLIRREFAQNPDFRARFEAEVQAARRVSGYHIVPVLDHNINGDQPWIATAYIPGLALDDALTAFGPLPLPAVFQLIGCTAHALGIVHAASVIHRDLKPSNILLSSDGPWVIDFGIARATDTTQLTRTGGFIGTPQYMSPEHALGQKVTPATDIFALGLIAAVVATGRHPYGDGSGLSIAAQIANTQAQPPDLSGYPEQLRPLLQMCLTADPAARPTPAALADWCRRASGRTLRDFTDWLPAPLAQEIARRGEAAERPQQPEPAEAAPPPGFGPAYAPTQAAAPAEPPATYVSTQAPAPAQQVAYAPTQAAAAVGQAADVPAQQAYAPTQAAPPSANPAPTRPARRKRKPLITVATVAALAVIGGLIWASGGDDAPRDKDPSTYWADEVQGEGLELDPIPVDGGSARLNTYFDLDAPLDGNAMGTRKAIDEGTEEVSMSADTITFHTKFGKAKSGSAKDCATAAQGKHMLPAKLEDDQLAGPDPLIRRGDILCTITTDKNLAMLEITNVYPPEQREDEMEIPGYNTQWTRYEP